MITAIIVEDESFAAQNLHNMIKSIDTKIDIIGVLQSVEDSIEWFSQNQHPDVVFMDIHLADGDSFEIFEQVEIKSQIIFTTAYDEYALRAFEVNSIDYLLKPIDTEDLERALQKLTRQTPAATISQDLILKIMDSFQEEYKYKNTFLVSYRDKLVPVSVDNMAYVYTEDKQVWIVCFDGQRYSIGSTLNNLMDELDPKKFYRANRQYIVAHKAIKDMSIWFQGKLAINLTVPTEERIIVSRAKSDEFKDWFVDNAK